MTFECDYSFLLTLHVINWNMSLVTQTILFSLTLNKIITFWYLNHSFPLSLFSMGTASLKCTSNGCSSHSISACTEWSVKSYEHKQKPIKIHNLHIDCWRCKTKKVFTMMVVEILPDMQPKKKRTQNMHPKFQKCKIQPLLVDTLHWGKGEP